MMSSLVYAGLAALFIALLVLAYRPLILNKRREFLAGFRFPQAVLKRFEDKHPELDGSAIRKVQDGLRQYFEVCQRVRGKFVSMPSQVVDDLWHEFILFTRNYENFCRKAFGRYLHHTPVEAMASPRVATSGIRRTWFHACRIEGVNPKRPERLPLLFALDAQLGIANGFFYSLDCRNPAISSSNSFCASDIGCGTGSGCGSGTSCGGDSGGHGGGGDGGSSCGGGCGGGGD
jgi:hypothetical protein